MSRLITLSFDGSLESDLQVTINVSENQGAAFIQEKGTLPRHSNLTEYYLEWRNSYRSLERQTRAIHAKAARVDGTTASLRKKCQEASTHLQNEINAWLNNSGFDVIRRKLYKALSSEEDTRLLIQADDPKLWLLPWHLWTDLEEYPDLEIGFSRSSYAKSMQVERAELQNVRILAIFGDDRGIDTEVDESALQALSASITILRQPSPQMFAEALWEQSWDILFFAGHSRTAETKGYLQLNQTDSISINELRRSLKRAIAQGMQLAIFNSCDGLGLAWELEELNIPQMILMRELVPDIVAQKFLRYFLSSFSQGETLYTSVRHARDRLESLEHEYPCATWLPVICQNPAFSPPVWHVAQQKQTPSLREPFWIKKIMVPFGMGVVTTGVVLAARFSGLLQPFELWIYDIFQSNQIVSDRPSDILIVAITEDDLSIPIQRDRVDSLSPRALNKLLSRLNRAGASVIGLDIFRDRAFNHPSKNHTSHRGTFEDLTPWSQSNSPLVTICQVKDASSNKLEVKPPQNFPLDSVGFSDIVPDPDSVVRRQLIAMQPEAGQCVSPYSLSLQLALRHLVYQDDSKNWFEFSTANTIHLGKTKLTSLKAYQGGYHDIDARGFQLMLRYRKTKTSSFADAFETVTLSQILGGEVSDQAIRGKVVLIGTTAASYKDFHKTPSREIAGVVLQAHMTNHLLNLANGEHRPIKFWTIWGDGLWILGWSIASFILASSLQKPFLLFTIIPFGSLAIVLSLWFSLVQLGIWIPTLPNIIVIVASSTFYVVRYKYKSING